jgi:hypothetical protein
MKNFQEHNSGEKANHSILIRVTKTQKERVRALADSSGHKSISDYVRTELLNPSIEMKVNKILELLQKTELNNKQENDK